MQLKWIKLKKPIEYSSRFCGTIFLRILWLDINYNNFSDQHLDLSAVDLDLQCVITKFLLWKLTFVWFSMLPPNILITRIWSYTIHALPSSFICSWSIGCQNDNLPIRSGDQIVTVLAKFPVKCSQISKSSVQCAYHFWFITVADVCHHLSQTWCFMHQSFPYCICILGKYTCTKECFTVKKMRSITYGHIQYRLYLRLGNFLARNFCWLSFYDIYFRLPLHVVAKKMKLDELVLIVYYIQFVNSGRDSTRLFPSWIWEAIDRLQVHVL